MAFPANTLTTELAFDVIRSNAIRVQNLAQALRDESAAGPTENIRYVGLQATISSAVANMDAVSGTPGLEQYIRDQINDQTVDLVAEFTAMRSAMLTLRTWIFNNIPNDGTPGEYNLLVYDVDGQEPTALVVTSAQTATFRTQADAMLATIG